MSKYFPLLCQPMSSTLPNFIHNLSHHFLLLFSFFSLIPSQSFTYHVHATFLLFIPSVLPYSFPCSILFSSFHNSSLIPSRVHLSPILLIPQFLPYSFSCSSCLLIPSFSSSHFISPLSAISIAQIFFFFSLCNLTRLVLTL